MPYIKLTYEQAMQECPEQVNAIVAKLRSGTSKNKKAAPEELSYEYMVGVKIHSYSLNEILEGVIKHEIPYHDRLVVSLRGNIGRFYNSQSVEGVPPIVDAYFVAERLRR